MILMVWYPIIMTYITHILDEDLVVVVSLGIEIEND